MNGVSISKILAVAALLLAALSFAIEGPLVVIAVILLAVAIIIA